MSDAITGFGTQVLRGLASLGELVTVGAPNLSRDTVDATHMGSPEGWREFIAALKDGGEFSLGIQNKPSSASYQALVADFDVDEPQAYSINFPDDSRWNFTAIITGLETDTPLDNKIVTNATFKISGKPTFLPNGA